MYFVRQEMSENSMEATEQEEASTNLDVVMEDFQTVLNDDEDEPAENGSRDTFGRETGPDYPIESESLEVTPVDETYVNLEDIEKRESGDDNDEEKVEPDTEAVSEDELPSEATAKVKRIRRINSFFFFSVSNWILFLFSNYLQVEHDTEAISEDEFVLVDSILQVNPTSFHS